MASGRETPFDLRERALIFGRKVIKNCGKIPMTPEGKKIRSQLGASASSVGANYEEADGTLTNKDKLNKLVIARKEAREARYFLRLIDGILIEEGQVKEEVEEVSEIIRILSSMINKLSKRKT